MKKINLLALLVLLAGCGSTATSSLKTSSSSFTSEVSSSSTTISSSEVVSSEVTINYVLASEEDFEFNYDDLEDVYMIKHYKKYEKNVAFPSSYNGKPIVGIERNALVSSGGTTNILIPSCYKNVTGGSFNACSSIKRIEVESSSPYFQTINNALYSKDGLTLIAAPLGHQTYEVKDGTRYISNNAFEGSRTVREIILPESVEEFGVNVFTNCRQLRKINIPSKVTHLNESMFSECFELGLVEGMENVKTIGENCFKMCHGLREFIIPDNVEIIEKNAFFACNKIQNLVFGKKVKIIGEQAFAYCESIETFEFSSSIREIGRYAFIQNFNCQSLTLPEGLEVLEEGAFFYFTFLKRLSLPSTLHTIGYDAFASSYPMIKEISISPESSYFKMHEGAIYSADGKNLIFRAPRYESNTHNILEGCEVIEPHAFFGSVSLDKLVLPKSIKSIGQGAFFLCEALKEIEYLGTMSEFEMIEKLDFEEVVDETLSFIYHFNSTYSGVISKCICSDGTIELGEPFTIVQSEEA